MEFWEELLDGRYGHLDWDLETVDAAEQVVWDKWIQTTHPEFDPVVSGAGPLVLHVPPEMTDQDRAEWWSPALGIYWVNNAWALRSVAHRLKGYGTAVRKIGAAEADERFRWHLARCYPVPAAVGPGPLTARTYTGLGLEVSKPRPSEWAELSDHPGPWPERGFAACRTFWVYAFGSLVISDLAPRCQGCEAYLANTETGRRSTRRYCPKCAFQAWDSKQSPEDRRARWRQSKRKQRRR